jgi:hypothetical protein
MVWQPVSHYRVLEKLGGGRMVLHKGKVEITNSGFGNEKEVLYV